MVGPLVQHAGGELLHPVGDAVLGDDRRAVAGDEVVDAVVDLRVHMVGTPGHGFMFGMYKKLAHEFTGTFTGKGREFGGSLIRPEATGYGNPSLPRFHPADFPYGECPRA